MGYVIVGILCFIIGYIFKQVLDRTDKKRVVLNEVEIKEMAKKNADVELKKIKEKLSKGTKEKDRDEIIKGIDNYFTVYGNPFSDDDSLDGGGT